MILVLILTAISLTVSYVPVFLTDYDFQHENSNYETFEKLLCDSKTSFVPVVDGYNVISYSLPINDNIDVALNDGNIDQYVKFSGIIIKPTYLSLAVTELMENDIHALESKCIYLGAKNGRNYVALDFDSEQYQSLKSISLIQSSNSFNVNCTFHIDSEETCRVNIERMKLQHMTDHLQGEDAALLGDSL
jgi:hypothetical protein